MVDIQSAMAEIRRGKKERRKKEEETTEQKYNGLPYSSMYNVHCVPKKVSHETHGGNSVKS